LRKYILNENRIEVYIFKSFRLWYTEHS
jgi:hypothetical protein